VQKAVPRSRHALRAENQEYLEGLADNDIHRLVRVTAHKRLVQETAS
jgi:hypothetical protein